MKRTLFLILVCCLLLVILGCKVSKFTLVSWSQNASSVSIKYRVSNLGDKDILSYTIHFVLETTAGQHTATHTFNEIIGDGSLITRTYVYTKPFPMDVTNVTISNHSAEWSP